MRAIVITKPGGPAVLELRDVPTPEPARGEVRVRVRATAINRADLLQRLGLYPPPADAPKDIPGLEFAGEVEALGEGVTAWKAGDRVFGLTGGGAYAEQLVVHARTLARVPAHLDFTAAAAVPAASAQPLKRQRIGLYQHYYGGNVDEGWTRFLLEDFAYNSRNVFDPELKKGDLNASFDIIILPDDSTATLTGDPATGGAGRGGEGFGRNPLDYAPKYRSGMGEEGVAALKAFVQKGGTVITLGTASNFAIDKLGVKARNIVANLTTKQFWCPGSTLKVTVDPANPLGFGMPKDALALYLQGDPVFDIQPTTANEKYTVVVSYDKRDILQSGWLVGEGNITGKAAMISAEMGQGKVILVGFRTEHRAQTYGTFKLLFNSLLN